MGKRPHPDHAPAFKASEEPDSHFRSACLAFDLSHKARRPIRQWIWHIYHA